jgi:hypothetical protein
LFESKCIMLFRNEKAWEILLRSINPRESGNARNQRNAKPLYRCAEISEISGNAIGRWPPLGGAVNAASWSHW